MSEFIARPISRAQARQMCEDHPHAGTLPNSSKYYIAAYIGGRLAGLAVWGYGVMPRATPKHMFGEAGNLRDYLELSRFFIYDWCPANTASRFLSFTHRTIKKYAPWVKWLYTYAAGFQGMIGTIYQAANYDYIGRQLCNSFVYLPSVGLVHSIALYHRYGTRISGSNNGSLEEIGKFYPGATRWSGYNFRYIYWLCNKREKRELMAYANFKIEPYPTEADMEIWLEDSNNNRTDLTVEFAKSIPIVKLPTAGHMASADA